MRKSLYLLPLPLAACATTPIAAPPLPPAEAAVAPAARVAAAEAAQEPTRLAYPATRRTDLVEKQFGVAVADPYRWLENDVRTDAEVKAWVDAQNAVTDAFLASLPGREALEQRITQLYDY